MVKMILMLVIALIFGLGTFAGLLLKEGKLNAETFQAFTDPAGYAETQAKLEAETKKSQPALGTLAQQLNDRASALDERSLQLDERENQIKQREDDLQKVLADVEMLQKSINESYDAAAESRETQLKTIAITVESMEPESAAQMLETMPTDQIAEILTNVKEKQRAEILDTMTTESAARVIKEILDTRE